MRAADTVTAALLAVSLALSACAAPVRRPPSDSAASNATASAPSPQGDRAGESSKWIWWTAAGLLAAVGVVTIVAYVIVPAIAEGTAKGVAQNAGPDSGEGGGLVLPL